MPNIPYSELSEEEKFELKEWRKEARRIKAEVKKYRGIRTYLSGRKSLDEDHKQRIREGKR